jgi:hypothetical protein
MSDTSDKKNKTVKKKESGFVALLKGMGCFFVCLFFFIAVATGAGFYFFVPIIRAVAAEEKLPDFEGPTEHDFWSLQEKTIANGEESQDINKLSLTSGEYNAMLASIQIPPVSGFCLSKVRHSYKNKELRYFLIGSGYTFRKLIISFVVFKDGTKSYPSEIRVNSWKVSGDTLKEKYVKGVIDDVADADKSGLLKKIISGTLNPFM